MPRLQDLPPDQRPRERLIREGVEKLRDDELVALTLRSGGRGNDVLTMAETLLRASGGLPGLLRQNMADFRRTKGVGLVKALQLSTSLELARRILRHEAGQAPVLGNPPEAWAFLRPLAVASEVERFWVVSLNSRRRVLACQEVAMGTVNRAAISPREVFREALGQGAAFVLCAHNHPSGDPSPSAADITLTRHIREAGETLGVHLADHLILGEPSADPSRRGYFSFLESGLI